MKRRIGSLRGKPIVEGDINLKTINEIHKDELKGSTGASDVIYYKSTQVKLGSHGIPEDQFCLVFGTSYAQGDNSFHEDLLCPSRLFRQLSSTRYAICYAGSFEPFLMNGIYIESLEHMASLSGGTLEDLNLVRITKEEFYNLKGDSFRP